MFASVLHPVAILSAVFCVICSLLTFVSDVSGDENIVWNELFAYDDIVKFIDYICIH